MAQSLSVVSSVPQPSLALAPQQPKPVLKVSQAKPTQKVVTKTFYRDAGSPTVYDNTGRQYSNPQEFLKAGGDWNKVIVKQPAKQTTAIVDHLNSLSVTGTPQTANIMGVVGDNPNLPKPQDKKPASFLDTVGKAIQYPLKKTAQLATDNVLQPLSESVGARLLSVGQSIKNGNPAAFLEDWKKTQEQFNTPIKPLPRSLTPQESSNLEDVLEGKAQPLNDIVATAVQNRQSVSKLENIALIANVDAGLNAKKPKTAPQEVVKPTSLHQEALKYKSVDEFVNKEKIGFPSGLYKAYRELTPKEFLDKARKNSDYYITSDQKSLLEAIKSKTGSGLLSAEQLPKQIELNNAGGGGIIKLTPEQADYFLNTKSQLTDIYNKAHEGKIPKIETIQVGRDRGFVTSANEAGYKVQGTDKITTRNTSDLAIKAKNLVKDDIVAAEKMAQGTGDASVAATSELIKHYDDLVNKAKTSAEKATFQDKIAVLANEKARELTDAGRTVQAAQILNMQTPEGNLRFASRLIQKYNEVIDQKGSGLLGLRKKIPELTGEQAKAILDEAKTVFAMSEGEAKAIAFQKLQNRISALIPSKAYDKVISVWKAGLLTGVKTTGVNIAANTSHGITEIIKDVPAAVVDKITSLFTGKRTNAFTVKGAPSGLAEGIQKGWRYLRTGYDERNIATKLDYNKVNFTSKAGKIVQKYEDAIFRLLGAEDQPFYYAAKSRSMVSQAIAEAKNQGLKGIEQTKFIENLVSNPTPEMLKYAVHDAEIAVFQNQTLLGNAAKGVQRIPGGEVVVPFGRTPAAVATQIVNYSPVGIVKTIIENAGKGKFDQRLFSQGIGRGITGTGAMAIGTVLFAKGIMTLGFPSDAKEQNQWELEGKKANSILINGKWRSISVLGPIGNVLLVGGYYKQALQKTGSPTSALTQAAAGAGKSLTEQTFLQGLNQFTAAVNDPGNYAPNLIGNLIGSTIPTIVGDVAQATDPVQRRSSVNKNGLLSPAQAKIPGLRNKLQPKVNALGQQVTRNAGWFATMFDPTRPSKALTDELIPELRRLSDSGNLATPSNFAEDNRFNIPAKDKTSLQYVAGNTFKTKVLGLMKTQAYQDLSDEEKSKQILNFADKARQDARVSYVQDKLNGLSGDQRKAKLSELKASGVMTKEVYDRWVSKYQ